MGELRWEAERLRRENIALRAELETARATLANLPRTADGVPIVAGDYVYTSWGRTIVALRVDDASASGGLGVEGLSLKYCYSTRAAAEAAEEVKP